MCMVVDKHAGWSNAVWAAYFRPFQISFYIVVLQVRWQFVAEGEYLRTLQQDLFTSRLFSTFCGILFLYMDLAMYI